MAGQRYGDLQKGFEFGFGTEKGESSTFNRLSPIYRKSNLQPSGVPMKLLNLEVETNVLESSLS